MKSPKTPRRRALKSPEETPEDGPKKAPNDRPEAAGQSARNRRSKKMKKQERPLRSTPVSEAKRVDLFLPSSVWKKLKARADKKKRGVAREAAEVLAKFLGEDGV
jgi:hypothetical protein